MSGSFDLAGARRAGYSDTEIADALAQRRGFNAAGARQAGYSDADIIARLTQQTMGERATDAAAKAGTGVVRGVGGLAGAARDLGNLAAGANRWVLERGLGPDLGGRIANYTDAIFGVGPAAAGPLANMPTGQEATQGIFQATGLPERDAETAAGRIGQRAIEFGVGSLLPGGVARNFALGAASGAAAQGAAEAGAGTLGQMGAALAVPGVAAAGLAARGQVGNLAARAIEGVTPQQMAAAERLMEQARQAGTNLTVAEALQQVSGPNPALQTMQRVAEQSEGGNPVMRPFMAERAAGNPVAAERGMAGVAPSAPADAPMIPTRLSRAAELEIRAAQGERTRRVRPIYAQAQAELSSATPQVEAAVQRAVTDIEAVIASDQTGILARQLEPVRRAFQTPNGVLTDFENIDRARKYFRDTLAAPPAPGALPIDRELAARLGGTLQRLRDDLVQINDAVAGGPGKGAFGRALQSYEDITRNRIEPLEFGLVGRVRDTNSAAGQYETLIPRAPGMAALPTSPIATSDAVARLARRDPQAARDLVGTYLRGAFAEASQRFKTNPNTTGGGAAFSAMVAGNPEQRAVLRAAFEALPNGREAWRGFERLLEVFDAQQFRPAPGSMTTFNTEAVRDLSRGGAAQMVENVTNLPALPGKVRDFMDRVRYGQNSEELAALLTSPEGMARLRAMARVASGSPAAQAVAVAILGADRASRD